jgi:hypothetical protein
MLVSLGMFCVDEKLISAILGLFVMMFLGLNCDIFYLYFCKSPLYCCYSAQFLS